MTSIPCTCGRTDRHIIARQQTDDGVALELWSDGYITGRMGAYPPGIGPTPDAGPRIRAAELAWQDASLYSWAELGELIRAARKAITQTSFPPLVAMRRLANGESWRIIKMGRVVIPTKRSHHHSCPCRMCGGRNLLAGWIPGPPKYV